VIEQHHSGARQVGPYRLLSRIGEGGMGVVYLAQKDDGPRVALKQLRSHVVGDDEGRARLAREVTSLRRVRSPRVAEVIDADPWGEVPYVVTRYVPGLSLYQQLKQKGPVQTDDLRFLAHGLAEALQAVHDVDVLHRDVKPSNVLLDGRAPVLIDFGLARLVEDSHLTITGWLLGTPGYLAPEIVYGEEATLAADLHSWAATLVFAATGRAPYGTGPAVAVMDRVRRGEYDLTGLPADLLPVVSACLDPDPAGRPTARQVQGWLDSDAEPERTRVTPVARRRPGPAAAVADPVAPATIREPVWAGPADTGRPSTEPLAADQTQPWPMSQTELVVPPAGRIPGLRRATLCIGLAAAGSAAAALAPLITAGLIVLWVLVATTSSRLDQAGAKRAARYGARRSDPAITVLSAPWHVIKSMPTATLGCSLALASGGATAFAVAGLTDVSWRWPSLALGGCVAVVVASCGPFARRPREIVRRWTLEISRRPTGWVQVGAVVGCAAVLGVAVAAYGTVWAPIDHPPHRVDLPLVDKTVWFPTVDGQG
jgi:hypothetical protein